MEGCDRVVPRGRHVLLWSPDVVVPRVLGRRPAEGRPVLEGRVARPPGLSETPTDGSVTVEGREEGRVDGKDLPGAPHVGDG